MKSNGEGVFGEMLASIDILEPYVAYKSIIDQIKYRQKVL
jgi:hypothetical protein